MLRRSGCEYLPNTLHTSPAHLMALCSMMEISSSFAVGLPRGKLMQPDGDNDCGGR